MARITEKQLQALKPGLWLSESYGKGHGTFLARRTSEGIQFYFRHTLPSGKRDTLKVGSFRQMSLKDAREESVRLSALLRNHPHLRAWLKEENLREIEALRQGEFERKHSSLGQLLSAYATWLDVQGKSSAKQVRAAIQRHILDPWPGLAESKASSITKRELTQVISRVVEAGKGREAAKLRTYIRAAYAAALRAEADPTIPPALRDFNLNSNPAQDLAALSQFNQTRDTTLSLPELKRLWQRLKALSSVTGSALRLCILMGGQRPTQLVRLLSRDVDFDAERLTIFDPKGRRTQARAHVIPITPAAKSELSPWIELHPRGYALSSTEGKVPIRQETLSNTFREIAKEMLEVGELTKMVRLADIRRTIETLMAEAAIPMEVRAQLQSHGLGGVQNRHYDRYSYMAEKRAALIVLEGLITSN